MANAMKMTGRYGKSGSARHALCQIGNGYQPYCRLGRSNPVAVWAKESHIEYTTTSVTCEACRKQVNCKEVAP